MHRTLLIILAFFFATGAVAQRTEVSTVLGSGLFALVGRATSSSTVLAYGDGAKYGHTYNPYGGQNGFCDGICLNFRHISKTHFVLGLELGLEALRCKTSIVSVYGVAKDNTTYIYDAGGSSLLRLTFLNFAPFIGYRHFVKGVNIDYTTGLDLSYCLQAKEKGQATDINGREYAILSMQGKPESGDIRLRFQVSTYYHRFGIFTGYSIGLTDYIEANTGRASECKSRLTRFGISYRINTPVR